MNGFILNFAGERQRYFYEDSLEFFKNWKELIGYNVEMVNVTWITSTYTGRDTAEQIRNFLIDVYLEWNITYVLLAGDISIIPMRYTYQKETDLFSIPTDYYYAELTSDWDSNNDGHYAEVDVDDWPDFHVEVYVGRIPVTDPEDMQRICQKIIDYEQDTGSWKKESLFIGAFLNFQNEVGLGHEKTDAAYLMELLKSDIFIPNGFLTSSIYEYEGLSPSEFPSDYLFNKEQVLNLISKGNGFVVWGSHGGSAHAFRKWWADDRNLNNVPDFNEVENETFISSKDVLLLNDDKPAIFFSCSCKNADPKREDNLGKSLLLQGGISFIGATNDAYYIYGWKSKKDGGSMSFTYYFFDNYINKQQTLGHSFYNSLIYCYEDDEILLLDPNIYVFTLYGDPSLSQQTYASIPAPENPDKPSGSSQIAPDVSYDFSTRVIDAGGDLVYYIWDFGDDVITDPIGPYSPGELMTISHSWQAPGDYRIKVKAVGISGAESSWSEPFLVHVSGPVIKVESITGGLFKVNAVIQNRGDQDANNIDWSMTFYGGSIVLGKVTTGSISTIPVGGKITIVSKVIVGFGFPSVVLVEAGIANYVGQPIKR